MKLYFVLSGSSANSKDGWKIGKTFLVKLGNSDPGPLWPVAHEGLADRKAKWEYA